METFESFRVYLNTVAAEEIHIFKEHDVVGISTELTTRKYLSYFAYSLRWDIEVLFYQHNFFWSFGNYMVRNQPAIERYVNLIGIAFAFCRYCRSYAVDLKGTNFTAHKLSNMQWQTDFLRN